MKSEPKTFTKKGNNLWDLVPARDIAGGPQIKKLAKKAEEYLTRVIDEHPGTPWEMLASRELSQPMGWQWKEGFRNFTTAGQGGNNAARNRVLFIETTDPKTGRKIKKKRERPPL